MSFHGCGQVLLLGLGTALFAAGCETGKCANFEEEDGTCIEFRSLKKYTGANDLQLESPWSSEQNVGVQGIYGEIKVVEGSRDDYVDVFVTPFSYRGTGRQEEATREIEENFTADINQDEDGNISITTDRVGSPRGFVGGDIRVELPPGFDGKLLVHNRSKGTWNPGDVRVEYVGQATGVDVKTTSLGDCKVSGSDTVVYTQADCDGKVNITDVANEIHVQTSMLNSDVSVSLSRVDPGSPGGTIQTEDGNVTLIVPSDTDLAVRALTHEGVVDMGSPPEGCNVQEAAEASKTLSCGETAEPEYDIDAGYDGVGDSNVTIGYR